MENSIGQDFLTNSIEEFGKLKKLADKALAQLEPKIISGHRTMNPTASR